jgi:hypothetical protein
VQRIGLVAAVDMEGPDLAWHNDARVRKIQYNVFFIYTGVFLVFLYNTVYYNIILSIISVLLCIICTYVDEELLRLSSSILLYHQYNYQICIKYCILNRTLYCIISIIRTILNNCIILYHPWRARYGIFSRLEIAGI